MLQARLSIWVITQNICWTIINTIHLRDNKFVMVVKSKAPGDSKFYDNLAQAAIQLTSIISKESRNAPTCFRAKKTREKQQPDGLQGHHFQVSFNLEIILSMVKITQNTRTVLLLCAVSFNTSNAHSIIELY